ncbi:MAG: 5-deoxy-glucuronate isomerase [Micropruina sp.]
MMREWYRPAASSADDEFDTRIAPGDPGWAHTGLFVATLAAGESRSLDAGDCEWIVLPLSGAAHVVVESAEGERVIELAGRRDPFAGSTDLVYVPRDARFTVTSPGGGRIALPFAKAARTLSVSVVAASDVPDELRGAGRCSRQVRNFGTPGTLEADSIIACEVITPAGNWSSYPPHKHDQERPGVEAELEEIYYFELRTEPGSPGQGEPFGYQRVYGTDERPIDVLAEVRDRDVVLVPHGWHGPAIAPPGYDMYYLNVMAGPRENREWLICDDPAHAWIRQTWVDLEVDPRLPFRENG